MSIFVTSDPAVEPICIQLERILPLIEELAKVKNSEKFRALMMEFVDRAHRMASSDPTSLKGAREIGQLVCKLQEALDDNLDVSQHLVSSDLEAVTIRPVA